MTCSGKRRVFSSSSLIWICGWLAMTVHVEAADPPVLSGPISKCDAEMEYLSRISSTGGNTTSRANELDPQQGQQNRHGRCLAETWPLCIGVEEQGSLAGVLPGIELHA